MSMLVVPGDRRPVISDLPPDSFPGTVWDGVVSNVASSLLPIALALVLVFGACYLGARIVVWRAFADTLGTVQASRPETFYRRHVIYDPDRAARLRGRLKWVTVAQAVTAAAGLLLAGWTLFPFEQESGSGWHVFRVVVMLLAGIALIMTAAQYQEGTKHARAFPKGKGRGHSRHYGCSHKPDDLPKFAVDEMVGSPSGIGAVSVAVLLVIATVGYVVHQWGPHVNQWRVADNVDHAAALVESTDRCADVAAEAVARSDERAGWTADTAGQQRALNWDQHTDNRLYVANNQCMLRSLLSLFPAPVGSLQCHERHTNVAASAGDASAVLRERMEEWNNLELLLGENNAEDTPGAVDVAFENWAVLMDGTGPVLPDGYSVTPVLGASATDAWVTRDSTSGTVNVRSPSGADIEAFCDQLAAV